MCASEGHQGPSSHFYSRIAFALPPKEDGKHGASKRETRLHPLPLLPVFRLPRSRSDWAKCLRAMVRGPVLGVEALLGVDELVGVADQDGAQQDEAGHGLPKRFHQQCRKAVGLEMQTDVSRRVED